MKKFIINSLLSLFLLFLFQSPSFAATYYVRTDGGSATQCTGLADAPISVDKNCAFNHPFWAIAPQGNNPSKMIGGDTVIIDGSNNAQYKIGLGAPNTSDTSKCSSGYPWDCWMRAIPSGPDATHMTRVLGKGWDTGCTNPPQFWGTDKLSRILNLIGSNNVEVQCLEVTDHSSCMYRGPANTCNETTSGPYAVIGLEAWDSTNVFLKNVNIHGLRSGVHAGRLKDWTVEDSKIIANSFVGWDGDIGDNSKNSGSIIFRRLKIKYAGCGETYPGLQPYNCYTQSQGGYGDGIGEDFTGGDWLCEDCDISNNASDGWDLLYHNGGGQITIRRGRFENNSGNQIKTRGNTILENVYLGGDCAWLKNNPIAFSQTNLDNCRARGNTISLFYDLGTQVKITNTTVKNVIGDTAILSTGPNCNGTEKLEVDTATTFELKPKFFDSSSLAVKYYASGDSTGNGDGTCGYKATTGIKLTTIGGTTCTPILNTCNAPEPPCGQTTTGVDNCGTACAKTGSVCCVPDNSTCNAPAPPCGQTTTGTNNCGQACTKQGQACTSCTFQWCDAAMPTSAGQKTEGHDNCGGYCSKWGIAITCPICPVPIVCQPPTLKSVTTIINSNGTDYTLTK